MTSDDIGIALDYRTAWSDPRVVASNWGSEPKNKFCVWQEVAPTFSKLINLLGL